MSHRRHKRSFVSCTVPTSCASHTRALHAMSDWQHLSIRICLVTYVVHMGSLVCWFLAAVRGGGK